MSIIKSFSLILGLLALLTQPSWGAALAGHVILTKGSVNAIAEDGQGRALKRRSQIFNGDTIKTGPAGSVQIRFIDKALMTIKANSEMNIETYLLAQQGNAEQKDQALMSLVKGGFRTITGTIGKGDKAAYKVNTPAASIGIRGTNYEVQQESDGGFVMGVYNGGIEVENEAGTIELGEGADFNFTRVKPNSAPKGLLAPPPILGVNNATEQTEEESEESTDENSNSDEKSDDSKTDDQEEQENQEGVDEGAGSDDNGLGGIASLPDSQSDINDAIDSKLTNTIEETKDEFVESGGAEKALLDSLIEAGILSSGQTLDDLDPIFLKLVNQWLENPNFDVVAAIQDLINEGVASPFSFDDPYLGVDVSDINNPFDKSIITDQQYALADSGRLGIIAVPVNFNFGVEGTPDVPLAEAMLQSENTINLSNIGSVDYTGTNTKISIEYQILLPSIDNGVTTYTKESFRLDIPINEPINTPSQLMGFISNISSLQTYTAFKEDSNGNAIEIDGPFVPHINIALVPETAGEYKVQINSNGGPGEFVSEIELDVQSNDQDLEVKFFEQIGSNNPSSDEEWRASSELDTIIANGSWDASNNKPIMLEMETDNDGNRIAVIRKPTESNKTATSLLDYFDVDLFGQTIPASCGSGESGDPKPCDIQIEEAGGRSNISWGIWITEPGASGDKILLDEIEEDGVVNSSTEDGILAFWIAAERADINQLTGNAVFNATNLDCTNASQCIGFADDGLVRSLSAQFDVNFNTGDITNGNLNLQTATDLDSAAISTWDVNFSGSMIKDGVKQPEFSTESLSGKINNNDANIVGNIGGIFVKPGDKFAGAYNLGAIDDSGSGNHKHAAGVFSMDKQ
jgi:hypothetical protein